MKAYDHSHCVHEREQAFPTVGLVTWYECCVAGCDWWSYSEPSP